MNETCERLGVNRLPWFQLVRDSVTVSSFTANLTTISRVRAEIKEHNTRPQKSVVGGSGDGRPSGIVTAAV